MNKFILTLILLLFPIKAFCNTPKQVTSYFYGMCLHAETSIEVDRYVVDENIIIYLYFCDSYYCAFINFESSYHKISYEEAKKYFNDIKYFEYVDTIDNT